MLGDRIVYLHLTDNLGDEDSELALGRLVDWVEVTKLVARYGNEPLAVIETRAVERICASLRFLQTERVYPFAAA